MFVLILVLYKKLPTLYNNYILENTKLDNTSIRRLSDEEISVPDLNNNKILLFWTTWCGVCYSEMKKLNEMLSQGHLKAEDLIAISLDENKEEVLKFIEKENYQFVVAHDFDGNLARKFKITATPTIVFVNKNTTIDWVSTGVTPTLEKRIKAFLKK
ncbi:MAG: TlpA disulfide reductase family protein [Bdellovibrionota bacterium]